MLTAAIIAYWAATAFDAFTTVSALRAGGVERNPVLATKGGFRLWLKLAIAAGAFAFFLLAFGDAAALPLAVVAVIWGAFGVWNLRVLGKQKAVNRRAAK